MALIPGGSQSPIMEIFGQIDGAPLAAANTTAALSYCPLCMHWQTITSGKMWWNAPKIIKNLGDPSWRSGLVAVTRNFLLETWEVSAAGVGQEKFSHEGAAKLFLIPLSSATWSPMVELYVSCSPQDWLNQKEDQLWLVNSELIRKDGWSFAA